MKTAAPASIKDGVLRLKTERKALILAHNYQTGEIQDVADFVGDSLGLAREAARSPNRLIVFCGVHFMAETASILSPEKTILIPDLEAGCSLAATVNAEDLRRWKSEHPGVMVVTYVNSSAEVKAESDFCCTSSNAVKIVESIPKEKEILFVPDMYLGSYVQIKTGRKMHLWPGSCHVHYKIPTENIQALKAEHPRAEFLMHPECGCLSRSLPLADHVLSTEGMVRRARESPAEEFIVATETGILYKMQNENPGKRFYPANPEAVCEFMKMITLEKLLWSLQDLQYEVKVPREIADRARLPIERMVSIG